MVCTVLCGMGDIKDPLLINKRILGGPVELYLLQPVLHNWCNESCGMYYTLRNAVYKRALAANQRE